MFADKIYLLLLLIIPVLIFLFIFFYKKRKRDISLFISKNNLSVLSNVKLGGYKRKYMFLIIAIIFLILALARPQYGEKEEEIQKDFSEIIVALDISRSMLAEDIIPSRLEKAKFMLSRIAEASRGDKVGVIVFSGSAMWQCPMTYDIEALKMFLQEIEVGSLPMGGTQISDAIILASKALSANPGNTKVMVLISDGEDHDSKIKEALEIAKENKLKILSVGIGTDMGAPLPIRDESGNVIDYVKDRSGNTVISKINSSLLKMISEESGGQYFESSDQKDISSSIIKDVRDIEKNKDGSFKKSTKHDRFQVFLIIALLALIIEMLIPTTYRKKDEK